MVTIDMQLPNACINCRLLIATLSPTAKLVTYCAFTKLEIADRNKKMNVVHCKLNDL